MPDMIRDSITKFYTALEAANQVLQQSTQKIEDRKVQILALLDTELSLPELPRETGAYHETCRRAMEQIRAHIIQWQTSMRQMVERSEFVNRHEKSILVIVFADVKSGKSSLGNFVSGYDYRGTAYKDLYQPLSYTIEDFSRASTEDRGSKVRPLPFPENEIEATSTIQYYTLHQGLTWVDTPGLHSLTREHEALANEYIQFADLVLFLTSSSSPLKEDERGELQKLLAQNKPVMVVITKSDESVTTVEGGRLVKKLTPKPPEKRKAQDDYVMNEIRALGNGVIENRRVVSVSTKLARQAVTAGDEALFHQSNLDTFFLQMGEILSNQAVELKMRRPISELEHCIDQLIGDAPPAEGMRTICQEQEGLHRLLADLKKLFDQRDVSIQQICGGLELVIPTELSLRFRALREQKRLGDPKAVQKAVAECLYQVCTGQCISYFKDKFQMEQVFLDRRIAPKAVDLSGAEYRQTTMQQSYTAIRERPPKGFVEHIQKALDQNRKFTETVSRSETIVTGDNFHSYVQAVWEQIRPSLPNYVGEAVDELYKQYICPLRERYEQMDRQFDALTQKLKQLKFTEG